MQQLHRFRRVIWSLLAIIFLCASGHALDPHQQLAQLYHSSWTEKQGLNGIVTSLAQTTDGYLWVGTTDGLLRFDGISFEHYQPEIGSLMATSISAVMAVPDGGLWVGYKRGGASFIKSGRITNYADSDGFPVSTVRCFARDKSGTIWAAAVGGFARLEGKRWRMDYKEWDFPGEIAWTLLVDRDGTLWVAAENQIVFLVQGQKRFQRTGLKNGEVSVLTEAPDAAILFFDKGSKRLRAFRRDKDNKIETLPAIDISSVKAATFDRDRSLWVGGNELTRIAVPTERSLSRFKEPRDSFSVAQGLSNESVEAILEDQEGNVWVGTDGGLDRFRNRNVDWFPLPGGPFSLVAGSDGDVWAGSRGTFPLIRVQDKKPAMGGPTDVFAAYRDPDGTVWFSADNSLLHWERGRFIKQSLPIQVEQLSRASTPPQPIIASAITKDREGDLWVAFGGSGEFRLSHGIWTFVQILPDHPDWSAGYSFTDSANRIWLYWGDRIAQYDHGNIRIFSTKEGLAIGPPDSMAERDQVLWVGGESGLAFLQDGRFHVVQSERTSPFTSVTGVIVTAHGGIWLSTGPGVVHIPESEIKRILRDPQYKIRFELFDLLSDLPEPLQRGEVYTPGAIQVANGSIWFAARNGAIRVDPARIYRNSIPPPVSIRSVIADDKAYSVFFHPTFPAMTNNVRIEYAALSLSIPERVRFRYKLEPWDDNWHDAGGRREAFFTRLAPGQYVFRVIASNNDGVWNNEGATLTFIVLPAWYQTVWFRAISVGILLLLFWALYRLRVRQLHRRFSLTLEARVAERTRIARELHDTLLQSFQGAAFQFQGVRELFLRKSDHVLQSIDDAILAAEQGIDEGRAAIRDLRQDSVAQRSLPELLDAAGKELASAQDPNRQSPRFRLTVEGKQRNLALILQDEVYKIAREVIRNAFTHAVASSIEVEIRYDEGKLRLRIRDDGKGIDPNILESGGRPGHWGIAGMYERAQRIGARLEFWYEAGAGTEVQLTVPASIAYLKHHHSDRLRWRRKAGGDEQRS